MVVSHNEQKVRIDFGTPIAWFEIPKNDALQLAFTILEHCGAKMEIEFRQNPGAPPQ